MGLIIMNIEQANNLDFRDLLSKLGHEPAEVKPNSIKYFSPLRTETKPSFHIRKGKTYNWVWHDFGHSGNSTILDFIMKYKNEDKSGALAFLDTIYPNYKSRAVSAKKKPKDPNQSYFLFPPQSSPQASKIFEYGNRVGEWELLAALPLKSETVFSYLESRRIPRRLAQKYFRLVQYRKASDPTRKHYFGFGMQNKSGGWEVRSASDEEGQVFKSAIGTKDITVIKGREQGRGEVNVFEGQTNFVSLLAMFPSQPDQLKGDAIILNGAELFSRAIAHIREQGYIRINTFLDNDRAGKEKTRELAAEFGGMVSDHSPKFLPHTDLNDALRAGASPFSPPVPDVPAPEM